MFNDDEYISIVKKVATNPQLNFSNFKDNSILITGGTGLIGSFLIDVLMYRNNIFKDNIKIYMLSRSEEKIKKRFSHYPIEKLSSNNTGNLIYISEDVTKPFQFNNHFDYIIHGASNTHPKAYATDPIGTITTNVIGLNNLLEYGFIHNVKRIFLMSSVEIYGENRGDIDAFNENYLGYINCNTLRSGYPESKRLSESLCQAYIGKYNMDIVIGRLSRIYGPTMQLDDSKALSQFINKSVNGEDIVLKSNGEQYYSYSYVADAVAAILKIIFDGQKGEAYNISDEASNIKLKELAQILADFNGKKVVFELPDEIESKGYSTATKAIMNSDKLKELGWTAKYSIYDGLKETVNLIKKRKLIKKN